MESKIIVPNLPKFFKEEEQAKAVKFAEMLSELTGKAVYVNEFFDEDGGYEVEYYPSLGIGNVYKKFEAASNRKVKNVYIRTTMYFMAKIEYKTPEDLQEKTDEFETEVRLDIDNMNSGNYEYLCADEGLEVIEECEVPDWIVEEGTDLT